MDGKNLRAPLVFRFFKKISLKLNKNQKLNFYYIYIKVWYSTKLNNKEELKKKPEFIGYKTCIICVKFLIKIWFCYECVKNSHIVWCIIYAYVIL